MELRLAEKINTATTSFTKEIINVETRLTKNANGMEKQLTTEINKAETRLTENANDMEEQLTTKINNVETRLNKDISKLEISYGKIFTAGTVIVVIGAVIGAVSRFPSEGFSNFFK